MKQPRLANNANDLWQKFVRLSKSGKVGIAGRILYPVAFVPLLGYINYDVILGQLNLWLNSSGMITQKLTQQQENDFFNAIQKDQIDIELMDSWGGSGNYKERSRQLVERLHIGHGHSWK